MLNGQKIDTTHMHNKSLDKEMVVFVERANFIVLQSTDTFEEIDNKKKLEYIDGMIKSLQMLNHAIELEIKKDS